MTLARWNRRRDLEIFGTKKAWLLPLWLIRDWNCASVHSSSGFHINSIDVVLKRFVKEYHFGPREQELIFDSFFGSFTCRNHIPTKSSMGRKVYRRIESERPPTVYQSRIDSCTTERNIPARYPNWVGSNSFPVSEGLFTTRQFVRAHLDNYHSSQGARRLALCPN